MVVCTLYIRAMVLNATNGKEGDVITIEILDDDSDDDDDDEEEESEKEEKDGKKDAKMRSSSSTEEEDEEDEARFLQSFKSPSLK